ASHSLALHDPLPIAIPALTISKAAPASVVPGQNLTYTITYGNTGNGDATGVLIQDTVPSGAAFVSATGGGTIAGGVVSWNIGSRSEEHTSELQSPDH